MAIVLDSVLSTVTNATGLGPDTNAFNNVGGNVVVVGIVSRNGDIVTGVTYGGQTMTLVTKVFDAPGLDELYIFILTNAPTGNNNIVTSYTGSVQIRVGALSYSGASNTQPDNFTSGTAISGTSITNSLTTVADNSWVILWAWNSSGNNVAGTGSTARGVAANPSFFDSNGPVTPAGAYSMSVSWTGSNDNAFIQLSIAPPGVVGGNNGLLSLLGIGT